MRGVWGSKFTFVMAAAGSAVGLGNIWRFPHVVAAGGGFAFLFFYLMVVFAIGFTIMLAEFAIGRAGQGSSVTAFKNLGEPKWAIIGYVGMFAGFCILAFYCVVTGWTLKYLLGSISGIYGTDVSYGDYFGNFITAPFQPIVYTIISIAVGLLIVMKGVKDGIGLFARTSMPLMLGIIAILIFRALTLEGSMAGVEYYLKPDFSKLTIGVMSGALGQAFFSLSIGMAVMLTYASYLEKDVNLGKTAGVIVGLDTLIAFLAGLIILPTIFAFNIDPTTGPTLAYITMPELFANMPFGQLFSIMFFFMLLIAAFTSMVSIMEGIVAFLVDEFNFTRAKSVSVLAAVFVVTSISASLSMGVWGNFKIIGLNLFDLYDFLSAQVALPLGGILVSLFVGWVLPSRIREELSGLPGGFINAWFFLCRYVTPAVCIFLWLTGIYGAFAAWLS